MKTLFVAWHSTEVENAAWGPVGRLDYDGQVYSFFYTRGAMTLSGFRPFEEMPDLEQVYESESLFPLFANRLLSPSRPEYEAFLRWGGFNTGTSPDPIAILGVTEGIRQTDAIEVFPCPVSDEGGYCNKFFLHGIRWMPTAAVDRVNRLKESERLLVMPDPCNQFDPNAVAVRTESERTLIGYVPRYLAQDVHKLLRECDPECVELFVQRVNCDAPSQHRLLCRMNACWPQGFKPCDSEAFASIPGNIPTPFGS